MPVKQTAARDNHTLFCESRVAAKVVNLSLTTEQQQFPTLFSKQLHLQQHITEELQFDRLRSYSYCDEGGGALKGKANSAQLGSLS